MAKKTASAPAQEPATPVPAPAVLAVTAVLPEGLADLMSAASHAAVAVAMAEAALTESPGDADARAASESTGALLGEAVTAIDAWYGRHVSERLAAADAEAERQLEAKRSELATALDALEAQRTEASNAIEALKDTHAATEESGGGDVPADRPAEDGREQITVIGPAGGLRRAGHTFDATPRTVMVTAEEKAAIAAAPSLSITGGISQGAELAAWIGTKPDADDFVFDPDGRTRVKVLGPKGGRRRGGHSFGPEETIVRVGRVELEQLLGDDQLAVGAA